MNHIFIYWCINVPFSHLGLTHSCPSRCSSQCRAPPSAHSSQTTHAHCWSGLAQSPWWSWALSLWLALTAAQNLPWTQILDQHPMKGVLLETEILINITTYCIVRDVISKVCHGRFIDGGEPEGPHPNGDQVVQPGADPCQVSSAIIIGVLKWSWVDLVHYGVLPPLQVKIKNQYFSLISTVYTFMSSWHFSPPNNKSRGNRCAIILCWIINLV